VECGRAAIPLAAPADIAWKTAPSGLA
jgi:hypothetical protein